MEQSIILSKLRFFAYHGVMEQENKVGHYFVVSLKINCDFTNALTSDKVYDTINYGLVYEIVKTEMEVPSKLMEHLAGRIIKGLFNSFEIISHIYIRIIKENPPINSDCDGCGIEISVARNEFEVNYKSVSR